MPFTRENQLKQRAAFLAKPWTTHKFNFAKDTSMQALVKNSRRTFQQQVRRKQALCEKSFQTVEHNFLYKQYDIPRAREMKLFLQTTYGIDDPEILRCVSNKILAFTRDCDKVSDMFDKRILRKREHFPTKAETKKILQVQLGVKDPTVVECVANRIEIASSNILLQMLAPVYSRSHAATNYAFSQLELENAMARSRRASARGNKILHAKIAKEIQDILKKRSNIRRQTLYTTNPARTNKRSKSVLKTTTQRYIANHPVKKPWKPVALWSRGRSV